VTNTKTPAPTSAAANQPELFLEFIFFSLHSLTSDWEIWLSGQQRHRQAALPSMYDAIKKQIDLLHDINLFTQCQTPERWLVESILPIPGEQLQLGCVASSKASLCYHLQVMAALRVEALWSQLNDTVKKG
jgi:hypothetical protein